MFAAALALLTPAAPVSADEPDHSETIAETLFHAGIRLKEEQKYAEAAQALEASYKQKETWNTLWHMADCYEKLGRTASAWTKFRDAVSKARGAGKKFKEESAQRRVFQLEPELSWLKIAADSSIEGLRITLNGKALLRETWGVKMPVDPGPQIIEATAPGKKKWSRQVQATPKEIIALDVEPLVDAVSSREAVAPVRPTALRMAGSATPESAAAAPRALNALQIAGVAGLVSSAALLAVAAGFFVHESSMEEKSDAAEARDGWCKQSCSDAWSERNTARVTGQVLGWVGAGVGGAGLSMLLSGSLSNAPAKGGQLNQPSIVTTQIGVRFLW
jgi:tetratricopeptide (TPR) repeat protein